jgi:hypothetical protein
MHEADAAVAEEVYAAGLAGPQGQGVELWGKI